MAQDYTTIRVSQTARDEAAESKRESETWDEYLRRCTANPPEPQVVVPAEDVFEEADVRAWVREAVREALAEANR